MIHHGVLLFLAGLFAAGLFAVLSFVLFKLWLSAASERYDLRETVSRLMKSRDDCWKDAKRCCDEKNDYKARLEAMAGSIRSVLKEDYEFVAKK